MKIRRNIWRLLWTRKQCRQIWLLPKNEYSIPVGVKISLDHYKDCRELSGSLLEQLEEAFDYIDRYNRTRAEFSGLDHYYQDEDDEIKEMGKPIETNESKKIRSLDLVNEDRTYSGFSYFMDGSRRTYKIGDMVLEGKKI